VTRIRWENEEKRKGKKKLVLEDEWGSEKKEKVDCRCEEC
jgi:hypothetical protein